MKKILRLINYMFLKIKRNKTKSEFGKGQRFEIFDKILDQKNYGK